jgi:lysophospholipase L1-like esterase
MIRGAAKHCEEEGYEVHVYPGIKAKELEKKIVERKDDAIDPKVIIVNVGTNNIKSRSGKHLMVEINELLIRGEETYKNAKWVVGGLVYRDDVYYTTIDKLNDSIQWICKERNAAFYNPNYVISANEAAKDGLHLSYAGGKILGKLIIEKAEEALKTHEVTN